MKRFQAEHRHSGPVTVIAIRKRRRWALVVTKHGQLSWVDLDALRVTDEKFLPNEPKPHLALEQVAEGPITRSNE